MAVPLFWCYASPGMVTEGGSTGEGALASWTLTSVEAGAERSMGGGGRLRLYGYGSPLRIKVVNLGRLLSLTLKHQQKHVLAVPSCPIVVHTRSPSLKTKSMAI